MTLSHAAKELGKWCDTMTGIEGSLGYILLFVLTILGYIFVNNDGFKNCGRSTPIRRAPNHVVKKKDEDDNDDVDETPERPRNFTTKQLRQFDGKMINETTNECKPVYLSVAGTIFDVSKGREFYGPGGPYEIFAGRECGAALATMSFDESLLDNLSAIETLGKGDRAELDNWLEKFEHYRCYPIKGRLVPDNKLPSAERIISLEELSRYDGSDEGTPTGDFTGYATHPIYVGAHDKVFDVSFGGVEMYGKGGPYHCFAGKDASRALALMSLDPKDVQNTDISDLDEKKVKILMDWVNTFQEKKGYPVVGKLLKM